MRRLVLCISAGLMVLASGCDRSATRAQSKPAPTPETSAKAVQRAQHQQLVDQCRLTIGEKKAAYEKLIAQSSFWEASTAIRQCANVLGDKDLNDLVNRAELLSTWKDIKSSKVAAGDRLRQIEALRRDWPEEAKKEASVLARLETELKRREHADQATARRKEGVLLGMSADDVLASSWGRPQKVNRTTTARGTREQWVYGNGNYLYFEDGVLTAVQN